MTTTPAAVQLATDHFAAWTGKDLETALSYCTDDVEIHSPNGEFVGESGYHQFMDRFVAMLTGVSDFTVHGDDTTALTHYDTHLAPIPTLSAGERITVRDGRIARIDIVFDTSPMRALAGAAPTE